MNDSMTTIRVYICMNDICILILYSYDYYNKFNETKYSIGNYNM